MMARMVMVIGLIAMVSGCTVTKLETGYVPSRLGASTATREGYYARPFSEKAAEAKREDDRPDRRPTWGDY
jgi:hypothetical protein